MALTSSTISNTATSIFTSVGSSVVTAAYFCNSGSLPVLLTVHAVPSGNTATVDNAIYYQIPLTINDTYVLDTEKIVLEDGDSLHAAINISSNANVRVVATVSTIGV